MADRLSAAELTIDLAAVAANWSRLDRLSPGASTAAMVKADGYGAGAAAVAGELAAAGCTEFFVADVGEGIRLRAAVPDADIFVLAGAHPGTLDDLVAHRLDPVLISIPQIEAWASHGAATGGPRRAAVHFDTGMNRTGLDPAETAVVLADPGRLDGVDVVYVMSHLASADDADTDQNEHQRAAFESIRAVVTHGRASLANTPGIALGAEYHYDHVRPGVGLYGVDPSPGRTLGLTPVVELRVPVLQVRAARDGATVGYSATHRVAGERRLATLAVGYGDGVLRARSGRGHVAFDGHRAPIVGRVSMDLITVDITDLPPEVAVEPGSAAELIGPTITIDEVAETSGTIAYEILTGLGDRYLRRHRR